MRKIRVVIYGLGAIGALIAKHLINREWIELVGAIDIDPNKVGKDIGEVVGTGKIGAKVIHDDEAEAFLKEKKPDVVVHTVTTYLDKAFPQLEKSITSGANVVSTSETLAYPWYRFPELAEKLDKMAKENNVSVLGTGVNPGFIFDSLPAFLTSVCVKVDKIHVIRSIDAAKRRYPFQKKYGLSLSPEEFREKMAKGEITAHVGYAESIMLIASMLGIKLDRIEEGQEPVIAEKPMKTQYFSIKPGQVCGIRGWGIGYVGDKEFIKLELLAAVGRQDYDEVIIEGEPPLKWRNEYGTSGDIATAAMVINAIPKILEAPKGLITMKDITIPSFKAKI
ncbi:MAG: NAD(P)H-dependent amine dehydrogenase family protein [Candidatus Njordarchaeales archaeon]